MIKIAVTIMTLATTSAGEPPASAPSSDEVSHQKEEYFGAGYSSAGEAIGLRWGENERVECVRLDAPDRQVAAADIRLTANFAWGWAGQGDVCATLDGNVIRVAHGSGAITICEFQPGKPVVEKQAWCEFEQVRPCGWLPGNFDVLAVADWADAVPGGYSIVKFVNTSTRQVVSDLVAPERYYVIKMAISPDGRFVAIALPLNIMLFSRSTSELVLEEDAWGYPPAVAFSEQSDALYYTKLAFEPQTKEMQTSLIEYCIETGREAEISRVGSGALPFIRTSADGSCVAFGNHRYVRVVRADGALASDVFELERTWDYDYGFRDAVVNAEKTELVIIDGRGGVFRFAVQMREQKVVQRE